MQAYPRPPQQPALETPSHKLIQRAKTSFDAKVARAIANLEPAAKVTWLERLWSVIAFNVSVVVVIGGEEGDATEVFETLNERGVGLSTVDLLRNFLLGAAATDENRRLIIDLWRDVFAVSDNQARVLTFLRHFWISRHGDVKARGLYKEVKRSLQDQFERRETDPRQFSSDLSLRAETYRALLAPTSDSEDLNNALEEIGKLGANPLYPVLLAAISEHAAEDVYLLAEALISLYVRWSVIGRLESTVLERELFALAPALSQGLPLAEGIERLHEFAPDDEDFQRAFETASLGRPGWRRHVLVRLENRLRQDAQADEVDPAPPSRLHVEHIYPQTPASEREQWENHDEWVDRIGNLTLLHQRWNTAIRNGDFQRVKVPRLRQSIILLNRSVINRRRWNQRAVEERQRELAVLAPQVWRL